jgi:Sec-independent protein translocase protein TatA
MFNLDPPKLFVIAVVMIIVLGPERLPHFARQIGGAWRSFSEFRQRLESEVRDSLPDLPSTTELTSYVRSPSALLDRLASTTSADDGSTDSLRAMGNLPEIARGDQAHWTTTSSATPAASHASYPPVGPSVSDDERVLIEAPAPLVRDGNLN